MYICKTCYTKFNEYFVKNNSDIDVISGHNGRCPISGCLGRVVFIDDLLVDVIIKFWKLRIKTFSCCSGHLYNDDVPYLVFGQNIFRGGTYDKKHICNIYDNIYNNALKLKEGKNNFNIIIEKPEYDKIDKSYKFSISIEKEKNKIKQIFTFVQFISELYELCDKNIINEKMCKEYTKKSYFENM